MYLPGHRLAPVRRRILLLQVAQSNTLPIAEVDSARLALCSFHLGISLVAALTVLTNDLAASVRSSAAAVLPVSVWDIFGSSI